MGNRGHRFERENSLSTILLPRTDIVSRRIPRDLEALWNAESSLPVRILRGMRQTEKSSRLEGACPKGLSAPCRGRKR